MTQQPLYVGEAEQLLAMAGTGLQDGTQGRRNAQAPLGWGDTRAAREAPLGDSDPADPLLGTGGRILVVEDDNIVALELRERLHSLGYFVAGVASYGEEAVEKAGRLGPDLVLMDIRLRGSMDGTEAAEEIRTRFDLPVVYLTAYADEDTLYRAKVTQPYGYIIKPFDETGLRTAIEIALHKHKMERRLRQSQGWLATTLRSIGDAVIATDEEGLVTFMNPRAEMLTGWREVEAVGRELSEIFRVRDQATGILSDRYLFRGFGRGVYTALAGSPVLMARDGREIPIDDSIAPIRDGGGNTIGVVLVFRDVAERDVATDAQPRLEQEKAAVLDTMSELVVYRDMDWRIVWTNRAVSESVGCSPGQLVGQHCYETWPQRDRPCDHCLGARACEVRQPQEMEITSRDGRAWFVRCYPVVGGTGNLVGVVEVILEITARREMEEERERLLAELSQAQKMEAIGRLASGVAHDFNNYLTVIMGGGHFLLKDLDPDDPRRTDAQEILKAARSAASLTRQLLAFSRRQALEWRVLDLNELVVNLRKMLDRLIGEDVTLFTALDPALRLVKADPGQIEQVLMNLALNARDAMPEGGVLTITTENLMVSEDDLAPPSEVPRGIFVCLSVTDTGIGMDDDTKEHIFEPYYTTKGLEGGTGLGLSVVYGIVQKHHGWIQVQSQPGLGSTFRVCLPAVTGEAAERGSPEEDHQTPMPIGRGEGVLLVEDDGKVRRLVTRLLQEKGYAVFGAAGVQEALQVFARDRDRIDLVFSDVVLPDGTGIELVDQLLSLEESLGILLSSGYGDERARRSAIHDRDLRFIKKPYTSLELLQAVTEAVNRQGRTGGIGEAGR